MKSSWGSQSWMFPCLPGSLHETFMLTSMEPSWEPYGNLGAASTGSAWELVSNLRANLQGHFHGRLGRMGETFMRLNGTFIERNGIGSLTLPQARKHAGEFCGLAPSLPYHLGSRCELAGAAKPSLHPRDASRGLAGTTGLNCQGAPRVYPGVLFA